MVGVREVPALNRTREYGDAPVIVAAVANPSILPGVEVDSHARQSTIRYLPGGQIPVALRQPPKKHHPPRSPAFGRAPGL